MMNRLSPINTIRQVYQPAFIDESVQLLKYLLKIGDSYSVLAETEQDANLKLVELAVSPRVKVHPDSILGRFERLRELTRATKGKVNALSLTGEANKAGLDYRLINPEAADFAGSKINLAVDNMMKVYHQWADDKGTQLVFCDMSIPLSARDSYSTKDRRLYLRDDAGAIDMKRGTMHTMAGREDLPYFIVQRGDKEAKRFDVYDAASGVLLIKDSRTKQDAKDDANRWLIDDNQRQDWINLRETTGEIEQGQIDEYNNEHELETEGFEFFTREDIAGISGSARFSVYDDIKAKLIANGVPARFTLGSTPKMGAGTNVQRLLVGLHHIDTPWRPSDLEQREGRIIRRGNYLYGRDPEHFEVFIGRYATEQTYDTRRWQILEHKARGIEQLRNYDGTLNEIDDIEGEAANSADMKAAASGDPLILEETKLRNSVRRLEQLQAGHADEVLAMTRKARKAQEYADGYGPRYLDKISGLVNTVNRYPLDNKGFSPVTVDGHKCVERETSQNAIAHAVGKLRANEADSATLIYRGLAFTFKRHYGYIAADSPTGNIHSWTDEEPFSASGFMQRMANDIGRLPAAIDTTKARIEQSVRDAKAMRIQAQQPFQQSVELEATREAYKKTQRALLVKGPSVPEYQKAALAKGISAQKVKLEKMGFGEALKEFFGVSNDQQLDRADNYYATALHELGHWTGHSSRLDRDLIHPFGSEGYAKEELRAEIASMILGDELGIGHDPGQHAAYVGSWIKVLENDPHEIFRAAADAERIQDYVLGLEQKQVQEQAAQQAQNQTQSENRLATEDVMTPNIADVTAALITSVVSGIEQAQASIADWNDEAAQVVANENAAEAIELVRQGKFDRALDNLRTAAEWEEKHTDSMSHSYEAVANALEAGWRSWQQSKGVGKAITPEMAASFEAIPTDLSQLSHATVADYEKAVQRARLEEEMAKANPNSTAEDITAARELRKTAELDATVNHAAFQRKVLEIEQQQRQPSTHEQAGDKGAAQCDKIYLQVPYKEKNQAKELGAKWDRGKQSWYVPAAVDLAAFAKWVQAVKALKPAQSDSIPAEATPMDRQFLAVPYTERAIAKAAGAWWDKEAKSWYAGPMADMNTLKQWLPDNVKLQQAPAMTPREEFADALSSLGCIVKGEHPVMDGKTHRIATIGDKSGERAGFYVAHLDGHPAGHIQNNRTGQTMKWKAKGYSLSEEEKAQLQATSAAKLQEREAEQKAQQNTVANSVRELLAVAPLASAEHPYLQVKQARPGDLHVVPVDSGALPETCPILIGKDWKESKALREAHPDKLVFTAGDLLLAAQDVNGAVRSVQSIQGNGLKRFAAGGAKQGTFHVVGGQGLAALEQSPAIVIGEGYATADTLSQALGFATVAAFDSGNLTKVAKLLHEKFSDKPFIIAGDNDRHQELTEGRNPGKEKAVAAAKAVNGTVLLPIFAPGEQTYPANLEPVTPAKARSGDLSDAQKEAIAQMKMFTDFNDLATKSALGEGGVERQVTNIVNSLVVRNQKQIEIKQQQEHVVKLEQQPVQRKAVKI